MGVGGGGGGDGGDDAMYVLSLVHCGRRHIPQEIMLFCMLSCRHLQHLSIFYHFKRLMHLPGYNYFACFKIMENSYRELDAK